MRPCDRFEHEGLLRLEQGLPLDSHFDSCQACREARAASERLTGEIAAAGAEQEPPPQWQARVWAGIERRRAARRRRRRWLRWWLAPVGAAAALLLIVTLRPNLVAPDGVFRVSVEPGPGARRGAEAQPGDRLILQAATGGTPHAELRVYRDDIELVLRCSTAAPCTRQGDNLRATLVLPAVGSYQPLLLLSDQPLPAPTGSGLDADSAAALDAAHVDLGVEIRVQ